MNRTIRWKITAAFLTLLLLAACSKRSTTYLPVVNPGNPGVDANAPAARAIQSAEFGVSLAYADALAKSAVVAQVAPAPLDPNMMFADAHPGYVSISFGGYSISRPYQLTYPLRDPQVMVFHTADFAAYGDQTNGFAGQQAQLGALLAGPLDPKRCTAAPTSDENHLPYLPWTNAAQSFCAQLKALEFGKGTPLHGRGIRYITSYSQAIEPVLDKTVFYTFQGLTDDGKTYLSAVFPIETGVFPVEPQPDEPRTPDGLRTLLASQITALNSRAPSDIHPSIELLDALVESIVLQ